MRFTIEFTTETEMREFLQARETGTVERPPIALANSTGQTLALAANVDSETGTVVIEIHPRTKTEDPEFVGESLVPGAQFAVS